MTTLTRGDLLHLHAGYPRKTIHALHRAAGFSRKAASRDAEVERLILAGGAAVALLASKLDAGDLTRDEFVTQALAALRDPAHTAAGLGAGQFGGDADAEAVNGFVDGQEDYLDGFGEDIASGGLSGAQIAARAALYGGALWSVYQMGRGQGAAQTGLTQTWWDLDPSAQHCSDCPELADGSPYAYPDELPTYPGQDVECGSNCRCALRFEGEQEEGD